MFKRDRGGEAFDQCDVKVVEFNNYSFPQDVAADQIDRSYGLVNLESGEASDRILVKPDDNFPGYDAGHEAFLHCPRTEDDRINVSSAANNHETRVIALRSVRELAGALLCEHCRFSDMTPAEVAHDRAEFARAEEERIQATLARDQALRELQEKTGQPYMGIIEHPTQGPQ